jgi:hypothetical protein
VFDHVDSGSIVTADWSDDIVKFSVVAPAVDLIENKTVDENGIIVV